MAQLTGKFCWWLHALAWSGGLKPHSDARPSTHELTLPRPPCTGSYDGPILRYSSNLEEIAPVKASKAAEASLSKGNAPPPSHAKPNPLFITSSGVSSLHDYGRPAVHPAVAGS